MAPELQIVDQFPGGEAEKGYGYFNSGRLELKSDHLQQVVDIANNQDLTRKGRMAALAGLWNLIGHERGHNLGYDHDRGGIMDPTMANIPGEAYTWARSVIGAPPSKIRLKRRARGTQHGEV